MLAHDGTANDDNFEGQFGGEKLSFSPLMGSINFISELNHFRENKRSLKGPRLLPGPQLIEPS